MTVSYIPSSLDNGVNQPSLGSIGKRRKCRRWRSNPSGKTNARAAGTEHSNWHICVRAARPLGRERCGAGTGCSAQGGHADTEARRSVLTALPCATLVTSSRFHRPDMALSLPTARPPRPPGPWPPHLRNQLRNHLRNHLRNLLESGRFHLQTLISHRLGFI